MPLHDNLERKKTNHCGIVISHVVADAHPACFAGLEVKGWTGRCAVHENGRALLACYCVILVGDG